MCRREKARRDLAITLVGEVYKFVSTFEHARKVWFGLLSVLSPPCLVSLCNEVRYRSIVSYVVDQGATLLCIQLRGTSNLSRWIDYLSSRIVVEKRSS